jgi:hypothetical protein
LYEGGKIWSSGMGDHEKAFEKEQKKMNGHEKRNTETTRARD